MAGLLRRGWKLIAPRYYTPVLSSRPSSTSHEASEGGSSVQVHLPSSGMFVCLHPPRGPAYSQTQELRPRRCQQKSDLTAEQAAMIRRLRQEDAALWTVRTLARLFNTKASLISKVAPASADRRDELAKERELVSAMRPHKRRLYRAQRQLERRQALDRILAEQRHEFPVLNKVDS